MQAERPALTCSPSLSSYAQFPGDHQIQCNLEQTTCDSRGEIDRQHRTRDGEEEVENDFSFDCVRAVTSPISADQIFHNGRIKPSLPLPIHAPPNSKTEDPKLEFSAETTAKKKTMNRRMALRKLFTENDNEATDDSAASELDSLPSDSYCPWNPKTTPSSVTPNQTGSVSSKRMKPKATSSSITPNQTGSDSKRWKLKGLITRSPSLSDRDNEPCQEARAEPQLTRKMATKESGERRKSYLPYKPELIIGIFGNSGSRRNLQR